MICELGGASPRTKSKKNKKQHFYRDSKLYPKILL